MNSFLSNISVTEPIENDVIETQPSCSKASSNIESQSKAKKIPKSKPKKKVSIVDETESESEQIKDALSTNNKTVSSNIINSSSNNETVSLINSTLTDNNESLSKSTQTPPIQLMNLNKSEDKFTLKFLGEVRKLVFMIFAVNFLINFFKLDIYESF